MRGHEKWRKKLFCLAFLCASSRCHLKLTDKVLPRRSHEGNSVVDAFITIKVEGLKCVKQKISHIFVHVNTYDASIEIINYASTIHDLKRESETREGADRKKARKIKKKLCVEC